MSYYFRTAGGSVRAVAVCAAFLIVSGVSGNAWAQIPVAADLRALTGSVQDPRGLPLLGAFVAVVALGADQPAAIVVTDSQGQFNIPPLPDGVYSLLVGSLGFAGTVVQGIQVPTAVPLSLQLEPTTDRDLSAFNAPLDMSWAVRSGKRDVLRQTDNTLVTDSGEVAPSDDRDWGRADQPSASLVRPVAGEFRLWSFTRVGDRDTLGVTSLSLESDAAWSLQAHVGDRGSVWASSDLTSELGAGHSLRVGFGYVGGDFGTVEIGEEVDARDRDTWIGRLQVEDRWQVLQPLSIRYGVRYEHHNYLVQESLMSPSLEVTYEPLANTSVSVGVSYDTEGLDLARENASFDVMSMLSHANLRIADTSFLQPQRTTRYELAVAQRFGEAEVSVKAYFDDVTDELLGVYVADPEGLNNYLLFNIGDADTRGFELGVAAELIDSISGQVTYAFRDRDREYPLPGTTAVGASALMGWRVRQTHEVQATVAAELAPSRTQLTAIYKWHYGMPIARNGELDNQYGRFDFRVRQMLPFRALDTEWSAMLQVRNLLGVQYDALYDVTLAELVGLTRGIAGGLAVRF